MHWLARHYLWIIIVSILICGLGLFNLSLRPALPFRVKDIEQKLVITNEIRDKKKNLLSGSVIKQINNIPVDNLRELNEVIESRKIGSVVIIELSNKQVFPIQLIPKNDIWFLLINGFITLSFFIISALVWRGSKSDADRYYALSAIFFGIIIALGWPGIMLPEIISIPLVVIYFLCYPQAFLTILFFSYQFPQLTISQHGLKKVKFSLQIVGSLFSFLLIVLFFRKYQEFHSQHIHYYYLFYRLFRVFIFSTFILFLFILVRNLFRAPNPINRRKVQWILWGIFWGSFPYIFLWNLPQIFGFSPFIPEWIFVIFLIFIPISMTIAILRHRLFDIEIVLSRSLVYTAVIFILGIIYLLSVGGLSLLIYHQFSFQSPFLSIFAALIVALLFNPFKTKIQHYVDIKFFRISYHRFKILQVFRQDLEKCQNEKEIIAQLSHHFQASVPLKRSMFLAKTDGEWIIFPSGKPIDNILKENLNFVGLVVNEELVINSQIPEKVESYARLPTLRIPVIWVVLIPMGNSFLWFLSKKKAETKFWKEDLELALAMAKAARDKRDTIINMQLAIRANIEKEQAQKLSEWKSLLVSEVAHDLRAPLNTMLWKLRNLQGTISTDQILRDRPLSDIQQQIYRLQRLIQSLLTLADMEKGKLSIQLQPTSIRSEIEEVLQNLQSIFAQKQLQLHFNCPPDLIINADPIIFQEIILNIVHNAAKFSHNEGQIWIDVNQILRQKKEKIIILIKDRAGGIDKEKIKKIFQPFDQVKKEKGKEKGFHLGLYIVHEFTKLLKGEIKIESELGDGTTIKLFFPKMTGN